ncbi:MAG: ABC transporter ATP-binding protein, partial [Bacteroidia bacterium]
MEAVITANKLTKKFGDFVATNEITFEVDKGEIFGFLGANGAGKTTAMRMLCGLLKPSYGQATVAGFDIAKQTEKVKQNIGYMSQKFSLYEDLSVKQNFRFYGGVYKLKKQVIDQRLKKLLGNLGMLEIENSLVASLPLGWKQKLAFSLAMLHEPKIIFLDEPT